MRRESLGQKLYDYTRYSPHYTNSEKRKKGQQ
jgi:hypothetical protein